MYVRMYIRTDGRTFLPGLLRHLSGDYLKTEWWDAGVVICLGQGADLHMAHLMPLPLTISCSSKSRLLLPFWCRLTWVVPDKIQEGRKMVGCVCMCVAVLGAWKTSYAKIWKFFTGVCMQTQSHVFCFKNGQNAALHW